MQQIRSFLTHKAIAILATALVALFCTTALTPCTAYAGVTDTPSGTYNKVKVNESYESKIIIKGSITMPNGSVKHYNGSTNGKTEVYTADLESPEGKSILSVKRAELNTFLASGGSSYKTSLNPDQSQTTYTSKNVVDTSNGQPITVGKIEDLVHAYVASGNVSETLDVTKHTTYTISGLATYQTPMPVVAPNITSGNNSTWVKLSKSAPTFVSDGIYEKFLGVQIDGKNIAASNYTKAKSGGIKIVLTPAYLATLTPGTHTISIASLKADDGMIPPATAKFTVKNAQQTIAAKTSFTVKKSQLKKTKSLKINAKTTAKTSVSYAKVGSANKAAKKSYKYFKVNKKTGKLTIGKNVKKGTYKIKVQITAPGNTIYDAAAVTKTLKIKVA